MITRIWHGWTTPQNADAYETLLRSEVFKLIWEMQIPGYRGIELLRADQSHESEFVTIMRFDTLADVIAFAGDDYEQAFVPPAARSLLKRFDQRSRHYEMRIRSEVDS
ncbi:MAG: hypothetical protein R3330_07520 [Saprospiraceae bacterium]|nr:hypothetical protein [Saprospiraceae bacterium]